MSAETDSAAPRQGFIKRLRDRLNRGDSWLTYDLANLAPGGKIDEDTLEELESADILLHVIDMSNPRHAEQIESVENLLKDLALHQIPQIRVLNKQDLVPVQERNRLCRIYGGYSISARESASLRPLIRRMEEMVGV